MRFLIEIEDSPNSQTYILLILCDYPHLTEIISYC